MEEGKSEKQLAPTLHNFSNWSMMEWGDFSNTGRSEKEL